MGAALEARGLKKAYRRRDVVRGVSFAVAPGEIVGLLGPNGAGKSTSFNMVAGLVQADAGEIHLGPHNLAGLPLYRRARMGLAYLAQEPTVLRGLSAQENLVVALEAQGLRGAQAHARAEVALREAELGHVAHTAGGQLSGGERRRLEMARALLLGPQVLLLDEPFAGVDPLAVGTIQASIRAVCARDIGVLITDHNVAETLRLCDRAYIMADGAIVASGTAAAIVADPVAQRLYLGEGFRL
jgi:lipopolysaccharide export system ATP-binding protein